MPFPLLIKALLAPPIGKRVLPRAIDRDEGAAGRPAILPHAVENDPGAAQLGERRVGEAVLSHAAHQTYLGAGARRRVRDACG